MELFPLRMAIDRFCNRVEEREVLKRNIINQRPTVLISPRRYGKTSLANKVVHELHLPFVAVDLLTAYDDDTICRRIIEGVGVVLSQTMPMNMKALQSVEKLIKGAKISMNYHGVELSFTSANVKPDMIKQMMDALEGLEQIAAKYDQTVILFIDEFQRVAETPKGSAIQGAIRSIAQKTRRIAFLFSGSSRHLLADVFENSGLPLYMMCDKMMLERIARVDYIPYIQEAAVIQWQQELPLEQVDHILTLTERHSFYVNFLCQELWQSTTLPKDLEAVDAAWDLCYQNEQRRLGEELDKLTLNQRMVLKAIARSEALSAPTSGEFLSLVGLASGTVVPTFKALQAKDLIMSTTDETWRLVDPLMRYMLLQKN